MDSTTSSFLLNVNAYSLTHDLSDSSVPSPSDMVCFDSTSSSFMLNVDSFCASYAAESQLNGDLLRLSSSNEPEPSRSPKIERVVPCTAEWMWSKHAEFQNSKLNTQREIGPVVDTARRRNFNFKQGECCFNINLAPFEFDLPGCSCLQSETCAVCCTDVEMPSPPIIPTVLTYWEHLVSISRHSSARPSFSKREKNCVSLKPSKVPAIRPPSVLF